MTGAFTYDPARVNTFGARFYNSALGRFMTPDDGSDQDEADPQSWNLYSYVRNNPVTFTDPDGHQTVAVTCPKEGDCTGTATVNVDGGTSDSSFQDLFKAAYQLSLLKPLVDAGSYVAQQPAVQSAAKQAWSNFTGASCTMEQPCQGSVLPEGELIEEGLSEIAPKLTQFGWQGGAPWRAAVREIEQGGTIESIAGKVPTEAEARSLIQEAGGRIDRVDHLHPH